MQPENHTVAGPNAGIWHLKQAFAGIRYIRLMRAFALNAGMCCVRWYSRIIDTTCFSEGANYATPANKTSIFD